MRNLTTKTLMLGVAFAAATFAATPADALDRYEDGTRLNGVGLQRSELGSVTARDAGTAKGEASREPASAAAPCPGGGGGVWLNGTSLNGLSVNGMSVNGHLLQGRTLQGMSFNGPGLVVQERSPTGEAVAAQPGALRVTAVRLPDGRAIKVRTR